MSQSVKTPGRSNQPRISRRSLLMTLPMMPLAVRAIAQQSAAAPIPVEGIHNIGLRVSNVERAIEFYQGLFGAPILSRVGGKVALQIGSGHQYLTLEPTRGGEAPHINHFGLTVPGISRYQLQTRLSEHGIGRTVDMHGATREETIRRTQHSWLQRLPGDSDTMLADNHEFFMTDRDGVPIQLNHPGACGAGDDSCTPEAAPSAGLIRLIEINHITTFVHNYEETNSFYRRIFGLQDKAFQANFPLLDLGGTQFLMFVGGTQPGDPTQVGRLDHVSFNMEDFTVESALQRLTEYGLSPRPDDEPVQPLQHWVTLRMPERGGAPGGTPEVYFSDPDGIQLQLQHQTYCGGGNEFGGDCSI